MLPGKRYTLVLNFGYVESQSLSYMPWTSRRTYKDAKNALIDLATFFKEQYLIENEEEPKKCCKATKTKDGSAEFCTKCGHRLADKKFDGENFVDWLRQMSGSDNDSINQFVQWDEGHRWQFGDLEGSPNQRFVYQAEWVLPAALGHFQRDTITFETICKDRTKSKKTSFTYY